MFLEKGVADESEGHYINPISFFMGAVWLVAGGWMELGGLRYGVW
jgi:hypothetical protein